MLKWIRRLTILLLLIILVWLLRGFPLRALGRFLVLQEEGRQADAIVLLAGESPARALGAYDLYKKKLAPVILMTRGPVSRAEQMVLQRNVEYLDPAQQDRRILARMGVPDEQLILLPECDSTFQEAERVRDYFQGRSVRSILLVTSRYHSRRAKMAFDHVLRNSIEVVSVPTLYDDYLPETWWQTRWGMRTVLFEYQKYLAYQGVIWRHFLGEVAGYPRKIREGDPI